MKAEDLQAIGNVVGTQFDNFRQDVIEPMRKDIGTLAEKMETNGTAIAVVNTKLESVGNCAEHDGRMDSIDTTIQANANDIVDNAEDIVENCRDIKANAATILRICLVLLGGVVSIGGAMLIRSWWGG